METRISNFNLKGDLVGKIYVWRDIWGGYAPDCTSEGDVFCIIYLKGDMFCIILDICS